MARPIPNLADLRAEYDRLFASARILPDWRARVEEVGRRAIVWRARYASASPGVPWWWVAAIHNLESSANFSRHLHNGDSLARRTVSVPAGRPITGRPPFTWEQSAADALEMKGLSAWGDWTIAGALYQAERYNGWGYRRFHPEVLSPYLWSGTQLYSQGKYVADGKWSAAAGSNQVGAAALWAWLRETGFVLI